VILPVDQPLYLQPRIAEIDQQAQPEAGCFQVVYALCAVDRIQRADSFQFDENGILDQHIGRVSTDHHAIIVDSHIVLLFDRQTAFAQFVRQGVLINFSRNPAPSVFETTNAHPMILPDSSMRAALSVFICVHLWFQSFAVIDGVCGAGAGQVSFGTTDEHR
jgi:hypothetical protein